MSGKAIVYKEARAFNAQLHQAIIVAQFPQLTRHLDSFRVCRYIQTENFTFHLGWGARESTHQDEADYQALLIVNPNGWVLKSPADSYTNVYQEAGDLIVLNRAKTHQVVWDKHHPKPKLEWLYLFIDIYNRTRWQDLPSSKFQAQLAVAELSCSPVVTNFTH